MMSEYPGRNCNVTSLSKSRFFNYMAVLCGMHTIQYSARSSRLSVHKLFTSCIRGDLVSRDLIVDGDWLPVTE